MIVQCFSFSSIIVISGLANSVLLLQVRSNCIYCPWKLFFNSLPILLTTLLCLSWINLVFIVHAERMCRSSSVAVLHQRHHFSSMSVRPLVLLIIVGSVDDKACTHHTFFPTLSTMSDHNQPLGCLVDIIVLIALPLFMFEIFWSLLLIHVVFLLLTWIVCNCRPSKRFPFMGSTSDATV